jgi:hypothetical protein
MTLQEKSSLIRILGLFLFILGIYLFALDISLVGGCHSYSCYQWQNLPAAGSVIASMGGILSLSIFPRKTGTWGWVLLGIGAVLVYLSGGIILKLPGMLTFIASFTAMAYGHQLIKRRRITF